MINSVTITANTTRVTWERKPGEAIYHSRIWFIPFGKSEWAELTDVTPNTLSPAQLEQAIRTCAEKGYDIVIDDPEAELLKERFHAVLARFPHLYGSNSEQADADMRVLVEVGKLAFDTKKGA